MRAMISKQPATWKPPSNRTVGSRAAMQQSVKFSHPHKQWPNNMTGVQALNNFSYENRGLRMWRAYGIGPGKFYSADHLTWFGTPQGPTRLVTMETFSNPNIEVGSCLQRTQMSEPGSLRQLPKLSQTEEAKNFLVRKKDASRFFSRSLSSESTLTSANTC